MGYFSCLFSFIVNEKYSIRNQLHSSFGIITIFSGGITLAICYGLLFSLANNSISVTQTIIEHNTKSAVLTNSREISNSINQELAIIGQSLAISGSLYSRILFENSRDELNNMTTLSVQPYFRQYKFQGSCPFPKCPKDYGPLSGRSRFPNLPGFQNGSLDHTSVYMYSSTLGQAVQDDSTWNSICQNNLNVTRVIDSLSYQDSDLQIMYSQGPNTTVMFYVSTQIQTSPSDYIALHRTYPGILKNSDPAYDPTKRTWFTKAPTQGNYLYGPYKETFTQQLVITISSRQMSTLHNGRTVTFVTAGVMLLDQIRSLIFGIQYPDDGFGALLTYAEVNGQHSTVVWRDSSYETFDDSTNSFKPLSQFDPKLAHMNLQQESSFDYTDPTGTHWYVSSVPLFPTQDYTSPHTSSYAFILLTFAKKQEAESPLISLKQKIHLTTKSITTLASIICCGVVGLVLLLVFVVVEFVVTPLLSAQTISEEVVKISGLEEHKKNYELILKLPLAKSLNSSRLDEVGVFGRTFYNVILFLHKTNLTKKLKPKYLKNPFYIADRIYSMNGITWKDFESVFHLKYGHGQQFASTAPSAPMMDGENQQNNDDDLDVLGGLQLTFNNQSKIIPQGNYQSVLTTDQEAPHPSPHPGYTSIHSSPDDHVIEFQPPPSQPHLLMEQDPETQHFSNDLQDIKIRPVKVNCCLNLKTLFFFLSSLLLGGLIATMLVTLFKMNHDGKTWMTDSEVFIVDKQLLDLQNIANVKSIFVQGFFTQFSLDTIVGTSFVTEVITNQFTNNEYILDGHYLPSYSIDSLNPYESTYPSTTHNYSGYYLWTDAHCPNTQCQQTHQSLETKRSSLFDLKLRSLFYNTLTNFIQLGFESDGFTRYWPYKSSTTYTNPTSCTIVLSQQTPPQNPICSQHYYNSQCSKPNLQNSFPPYDPRCRSWYSLGMINTDGFPTYRPPTLSSSGQYVLTSVLPIQTSLGFQGVLSINVDATDLSNAINNLKILDHGYIFLVDSFNFTLVLSPKAPKGCNEIQCAETAFSNQEYEIFYSQILLPLQANTMGHSPPYVIPDSYQKGNQEWRLKTSHLKVGSARYILMATVPMSDITKSSEQVQSSLQSTRVGMSVAFAFAIAFFAFFLFCFILELIQEIIKPIEDLTLICENIINEIFLDLDLNKQTSSDMIKLVQSFAQFVTALKFGAENFYKGNDMLAKQIFQDALELFEKIENPVGISACHNNLAVVTRRSDPLSSEKHYQIAIENGEKRFRSLYDQEKERNSQQQDNNLPSDVFKAYTTLSDRRGNLAVLYLETNRFPEAFQLIEKSLAEDKKFNYVKGMVIKQGILGLNYLKQGELSSAEKYLSSAFQFVQRKEYSSAENRWNLIDCEVAEQIALYNLAKLKQEQLKKEIEQNKVRNQMDMNFDMIAAQNRDIESLFLSSIGKPQLMDPITLRNTLTSLMLFYSNNNLNFFSTSLKNIAQSLDFSLDVEASTQTAAKRVVLCLDYSGSMSGTKIKSAVQNTNIIFEKYITDSDCLMLIHFCQQVIVDFPLTLKTSDQVDTMRSKINSLTSPTGSTHLYDCFDLALQALSHGSTSQDWLIMLTDGEDSGSSWTYDTILKRLSVSHIKVIVVGIGEDVKADILSNLALSTKGGKYISAKGDAEGIGKAFQVVADLIGGQVVLEDF